MFKHEIKQAYKLIEMKTVRSENRIAELKTLAKNNTHKMGKLKVKISNKTKYFVTIITRKDSTIEMLKKSIKEKNHSYKEELKKFNR